MTETTNKTVTIELCADCFQRLDDATVFFDFDDVEALVAHIVQSELGTLELQMQAALFRMYRDDLLKIHRETFGSNRETLN